ncbi:hypothetical protein [Massilia sp. TWR1-2-2]|uniref:hypothetical protein n=1 Tax=Massilia sp. TWR1-2-2 TaxID=2804584 RepID=UPI003CEFC7D4
MKLIFFGLLAALSCAEPPAAAEAAADAVAAKVRDGLHDFDGEIGVWQTRLKRLRNPLGGSSEWLAYEGTTLVRRAVDERANLVELDVSGAAGRIAGVSMRLYHPASGQWSLHFANLANGEMTDSMQGAFTNGRGVFYGHDTVAGRRVFVRFLVIPQHQDQWRFEQAYSADGGKTWEDNWIAVDTRSVPAADQKVRQ